MGKYSTHIVVVEDAWDSGEISEMVGPFQGLDKAEEWIKTQEKDDRGMKFWPWELIGENATYRANQPGTVGGLIAIDLPVLAGMIVGGSYEEGRKAVAHIYLGSPNGKKCAEFIRVTKRYIAKLGDGKKCFDFYANLMDRLQELCNER